MPLYQRKKRRSDDPAKNGGVGKPSNVMYIGNIPHGFFEQEIAGFFAQFGTIWKVKVCRSAETGRSKGFGFVEFKHPDVARVAANAMNSYMLAEEILRCKVCSEDWVKERPELFRGWEVMVNPKKQMDRKIRSLMNVNLTESKYCESLSSLIEEDEKIRSNLDMHGIDYEYAPLSSLIPSDNIYHAWLANGKILAASEKQEGDEGLDNLDASVQLKKKLEGGPAGLGDSEGGVEGPGSGEDVSCSLEDWHCDQDTGEVEADRGAGDTEVEFNLKPRHQKKKKKIKGEKKPGMEVTDDAQGTGGVKKKPKRKKKKTGDANEPEIGSGEIEEGKGERKKSKKRKNRSNSEVDSSVAASGSRKKKSSKKKGQ
ncbi:hypothetical protein BSKO_05430 [Bryopsis sp. KO-2023]|nr:hypothetical protein BSKO_05430 [Bryopsis sp. KO-2023]